MMSITCSLQLSDQNQAKTLRPQLHLAEASRHKILQSQRATARKKAHNSCGKMRPFGLVDVSGMSYGIELDPIGSVDVS